MKGFTSVDLADVAEILNGKTPSKSEQRSSGHPVLKIKDVSELGEFCGNFESFVAKEVADAFATKHVRHGDTLVLNAAHNADYVGSKTYRVEHCVEGALATGEWMIIRPRPERVDSGFVHHWINRAETKKAIRQLVKGIHLYPKDVARLRIRLPPLPQQRRIAEILDKADALRAKRRASLAQLDALTQSIFLDMFGDPAMNPKAWAVRKLNDVAVKITDGEHLNPEFSPVGMPIVMAGDVLESGIDFSNIKSVAPPVGERFRKKCNPERHDLLLVSRGATIGRQCIVRSDVQFCLMGSVILIKPEKSIIHSRFLNCYLQHPSVRVALYRTSGSSAQQAIYIKDVRNLRVFVPPLQQQLIFADLISYVERLRQNSLAALLRSDALFASVQHRAFRGEL